MKSNTKKIVAGVIAAIGVYLIYKYVKDSKKAKVEASTTPPTQPILAPSPNVSVFPLKKGSKGSAVTSLQNLILKYDNTLLPKYGADGDFGSETEAAVQKLFNKKTIDSQADLDRLTKLVNKKLYPYVTPNEPSPSTGLPPFGIKLF